MNCGRLKKNSINPHQRKLKQETNRKMITIYLKTRKGVANIPESDRKGKMLGNVLQMLGNVVQKFFLKKSKRILNT